MGSPVRKQARDRRLARRLARKVSSTGEKWAPEAYAAYLAGLQRGMEVQEAHQCLTAEIQLQDIFGNKIPMRPARPMQTEDADPLAVPRTAQMVLH